MKRRSNRGGKRVFAFTLIELLVVLAVLSTVMGVSVTLIFMMFDFQQRQAEQSDQTDGTNRFVEQFRDDARLRLTPVIAPNDDTPLQWGDDSHGVTYELVPGEFPEKRSVIRTVRRDGQVVATEIYHLPDDSSLRFVPGEGDHAGQIVMSLWEQRPHATVIDPEELDPFTRTLTGPQAAGFDPNFDGYWRTIIVRVGTTQESEASL